MWFLHKNDVHVCETHHRCDRKLLPGSGKTWGLEPETPWPAWALGQATRLPRALLFRYVKQRK